MLKNKLILGFGIILLLNILLINGSNVKAQSHTIEDFINIRQVERFNQETNETELTPDILCKNNPLPSKFDWDAPYIFNSQISKYCIQKFELDYNLLKPFIFNKNSLFYKDIDSTSEDMKLYVKKTEQKIIWYWNSTIQESCLFNEETQETDCYNISKYVYISEVREIPVYDGETIIYYENKTFVNRQKIVETVDYFVGEEITLDELKTYFDLRGKSNLTKGKNKEDRNLELAIGMKIGNDENGTFFGYGKYGIGIGNKNLLTKDYKDSEIVVNNLNSLDNFVVYSHPFFNSSGDFEFSKSFLILGNSLENYYVDSFQDYENNYEVIETENAGYFTGPGTVTAVAGDNKEGSNSIEFNASGSGVSMFHEYNDEDKSAFSFISFWINCNDTLSQGVRIKDGETFHNPGSFSISTANTWEFKAIDFSSFSRNNITQVLLREDNAQNVINCRIDGWNWVAPGNFTNDTRTSEKNWGEEVGIYSIINTTDFSGVETLSYQQTDETLADVVNLNSNDNRSNFTLQVVVKEFSDGGLDFYRILFRATDSNNYYFANIDASNFDFYKNVEGVQTKLSDGTISITKTDWNFFKIEANGDQIRGFSSTDGSTWTLSNNMTDTTFTTGSFGFGMNESSWLTDDYFIVENPEPEKVKNAVLLLPFDSGANDESGFGLIPSIINATHNSSEECNSGTGQCYGFNGGVEDHIRFENQEGFNFGNTGDFSILVRFKTSDDGTRMSIVDKSNRASGNNGYSLEKLADNTIQFTYFDGSAPSPSLISTSTFTDGEWHDIAVIWKADNSERKLIIDGVVEDDASSETNSGEDNTLKLVIGAEGSDTNSGNFIGLIDEVQIHKRFLTEEEVIIIQQLGGRASQKINYTNNVTGSVTSLNDEEGDAIGEVVVDWYYGNSSFIYGSPRTNLTITMDAVNSSGDVLDVSLDGYGNNGTLLNGVDCSVAGRFGKGCLFDGIDDYIPISTLDSLFGTYSTFTINTWVNSKTSGDIVNIIMGEDEDTSNKEWYLMLNETTVVFVFVKTSGSYFTRLTKLPILSTKDELHMITIIVNTDGDGYINMFVNGVNRTGVPNTLIDSGGVGDASFWIGRGRSGYFNGTIDQVQIWDVALTPNEIYSLYINGVIDELDESYINQKNISFYANITAQDSTNNPYTLISNTFYTGNNIPTVPTLETPLDNTYNSTTQLTFCFTNSSDFDNDKITYYAEIWNDTSLTLLAETNTSIDETATPTCFKSTVNLDDGNYSWRVLATDLQQNSSFSDTFTITIDTTSPVFNLISPANNTQFGLGTTDVNITINITDENDVDSCVLTFPTGDSVNLTMINDTNTIFTASSLIDCNQYTYSFSCNDSVNNLVNSGNLFLSIACPGQVGGGTSGGGVPITPIEEPLVIVPINITQPILDVIETIIDFTNETITTPIIVGIESKTSIKIPKIIKENGVLITISLGVIVMISLILSIMKKQNTKSLIAMMVMNKNNRK